jgi:site-specific DNA-methyltransferase (cytosine-N4-specific)
MLLEALWAAGAEGTVVDVMCGSGTTLLEALLAGRSAVGIDVNPISVLISKTKIEKAEIDKVAASLCSISQFAKSTLGVTLQLERPLLSGKSPNKIRATREAVQQMADATMQRIGRWFSPEAALQHAALKVAIDSMQETPESRLLKLAWLRTVRKSSYASSRTGRLFFDKQKTPKLPFELFVSECSSIEAAQSGLPNFESECSVIQGSALKLTSLTSPIKTAFWHPPYFALYKYSSDVLRLELEWMGADRKLIAGQEIRDGFKTSNPLDAEKYLDDCAAVWREMFAACEQGARGVAINSDSTLAKKPLDIFSKFAESATQAGFVIDKIFRRETVGTQAVYHKSADSEIQTKYDYIILFRKP